MFDYQKNVLNSTHEFNRVAYYLDMGLGKTFVGSEKLNILNEQLNIVICPKCKIEDWYTHFTEFYNYEVEIFKKDIPEKGIVIINYDLVHRREIFLDIRNFTLLLDESSYIKNLSSKRTKFILKMKPKNVILLSGTPISGKFEELVPQVKLLDWKITKKEFYNRYIITSFLKNIPIPIVTGYKNINNLKDELSKIGTVFLKTEEVLDLPEQKNIEIFVNKPKEYNIFKRDRVLELEDKELIGDTPLKKLLYLRQICSIYNNNKLEMLDTKIKSTNKRIIIFYNFDAELKQIEKVCKNNKKPIAYINGAKKDLKNYEKYEDSITLIQYQSGSLGLNLQKSDTIFYYSLPLSSELFEQSKKRTHRIGQKNTCFYYYFLTRETIELEILKSLKQKNDYTLKLFEKKKG